MKQELETLLIDTEGDSLGEDGVTAERTSERSITRENE